MSPELHDMATRMAWGHVRRFFPHVPYADKEDMVQEAVINAWRHGARDDEPLLLSTITRTGVVDAARKLFGRSTSPLKRAGLANQVYLDSLPEGGDVVRGSTQDTYPSMLESLLEPMRPKDRGAFRLRLMGYTNPEIGEMLGKTEAAVAQYVFKGRRYAQRAIQEAA